MKRLNVSRGRTLARSRSVALAVFIVVACKDMMEARASCEVDANNNRICGVAAPLGHGVVARIGAMGNQWIGYEDANTGECLGWDQIGGTAGFWNDTVVEGTVENDYIATVGSPWADVCGVSLEPLTTNGAHTLTLSGYAGGYDYLLSYGGNFNTTLDCAGAGACYYELWGGGTIVGSAGTDYVVKHGDAGSFGWEFYTGGGSDTINNYSAFPPTWGDCGDGVDGYYGPPGMLLGCEP